MKIQTVTQWHSENPNVTPYVTEGGAISKRGYVITHGTSRVFVKTKAQAEAVTEVDFTPRVCEPWEYSAGLSNLEAMQN